MRPLSRTIDRISVEGVISYGKYINLIAEINRLDLPFLNDYVLYNIHKEIHSQVLKKFSKEFGELFGGRVRF